MKRHMNLIRRILELSEDQTSRGFIPCNVDGFTSHQLHYHIGLCSEAGYLHVLKTSGPGVPFTTYSIDGLTWLGHETLEAMRGSERSRGTSA